MQTLFGEIDQDVAERMAEDGCESFRLGDQYFEYELSMDTDTIRITDTLGRMIPFSPEDMKSLFKAVRIAKAYAKPIVEFEQVEAELEEGQTWCV